MSSSKYIDFNRLQSLSTPLDLDSLWDFTTNDCIPVSHRDPAYQRSLSSELAWSLDLHVYEEKSKLTRFRSPRVRFLFCDSMHAFGVVDRAC